MAINCLRKLNIETLTTYTISRLRHFGPRQFKKKKKNVKNLKEKQHFQMCTETFLRERQRNETKVAEEHCWAITQVAEPIRIRCDGFRISNEIRFLYKYSRLCTYSSATCAGTAGT